MSRTGDGRPLSATSGNAVSTPTAWPLVSAICPTYNRRAFLPRCIAQFQAQDYAGPTELVIVDDGTDDISDLVPDDERIRLVRLLSRQTIGMKRNIGCEAANGEYIVHLDDDDWQASWRISYQVQSLLDANADICGLDCAWHHEPSTGRVWENTTPAFLEGGGWLTGTLCFKKEAWRGARFDDRNEREDATFHASPAKRLLLRDSSFYVLEIHPGNTSGVRPDARTALCIGLGIDKNGCRLALSATVWREQDEDALVRRKERRGPLGPAPELVCPGKEGGALEGVLGALLETFKQGGTE